MKENPFYNGSLLPKEETEDMNADLLEELSITREEVKPWSSWKKRFSATASRRNSRPWNKTNKIVQELINENPNSGPYKIRAHSRAGTRSNLSFSTQDMSKQYPTRERIKSSAIPLFQESIVSK